MKITVTECEPQECTETACPMRHIERDPGLLPVGPPVLGADAIEIPCSPLLRSGVVLMLIAFSEQYTGAPYPYREQTGQEYVRKYPGPEGSL